LAPFTGRGEIPVWSRMGDMITYSSFSFRVCSGENAGNVGGLQKRIAFHRESARAKFKSAGNAATFAVLRQLPSLVDAGRCGRIFWPQGE